MKMSVALKGNPLASRHEKAVAQAERRKVLTSHTISVLKNKGYLFKRSLRLPGAFAYEAELEGALIRVGIKNAADRWVAIPKEGKGMIGEVDRVAVSAFDSWENPSKVEVWLFDASKLLAKVEAAQAVIQAHEIRGLPFIPISGGGERRLQIIRVTGTLDAIGQCIDSEAIEWIRNEKMRAGYDDPSLPVPVYVPAAPAAPNVVDRAEIADSEAAEADGEGPLTIPEAKRRLAKTFGVKPQNIKITIIEA